MSLYKHYRTDAKLEIEGRWFDIKPANDDGSIPGFLLKRRGSRNAEFMKANERIVRNHKMELDNGTMDSAEARSIIVETFVDAVLKDWRNIPNEYGGGEQEFNRANALKLFTDLPDLFDKLNEQAGLMINYQDKLIEAAGKK